LPDEHFVRVINQSRAVNRFVIVATLHHLLSFDGAVFLEQIDTIRRHSKPIGWTSAKPSQE
jgi:hypothetical protein